MREPVTWDRVADPAGIAEVVHPGWVQRALTAEDWRGFPGNEPGEGDGVSKVERLAQQIFDKLAELHITYVHEPAESVPGAQRVRAVDEVLPLGQATCLDMCATFCSAALDAGIYPLLLTVRQEERRRHALVLVPVDRRWSFGVPALLDEGFSRSPLVLDGDDVRDLVASAPDDAMGTWLAIDVEQATYSADRDAGDWACAIAAGASYVNEWDWDVCVDVGGIRAQQDNSSELPTLARTEKVLAPGYLPLPDDSTPLQMIRTRYGVVPFCSRSEYRELREWAVGTAKSSGRKPDVSVAVLTGAGGTGKTRMAAQLCHDLEVLGWYTGFVPAKSAMKNDELTYLAELTTELLIVVDYAEESRQEQVATLLRALRGRRSPTRIVLTARGIDSWWEDFREDLESDGIQLGQGLVKELEPRPDPVLLYRQAVRGFSKVINGVNPPEVVIPKHAGDTALDIVLRAWLAVVDDSGMQDPQSERSVEGGERSVRAANPNARDSLYDRVLRLEFNRWRAFPELWDISLIHLRRIAATLSLLVPDASQVDDVLSRLLEWRDEHLRRSRVAELLSTTLLRSAGDGGASLRPDPVAEHLILSVFGGDPDQVDAVLPGDPLEVPGISEPDASEATVTRALMLGQQAQNLSQVITRAASQDRESASKLARHILKTCPHLWSSALEVSLAQGGPFVGALEYLVESGVDLPFEEIENSIPLEHSTLRGVALAAVQHMEERSENYPAERAHYLRRLANRLSKAGRRNDALEAAQEAIVLYRKLVALYPEMYTSDLAMMLDNLGNRLSEVGRREEGLEAVREAVEQYRLLAAKSPETYASNLASSLNNLAYLLSGVGYRDEAAKIGEEAVSMYRSLVAKSSSNYLPDMAASLDNLAIFLSGAGRQLEALEVVREATGIYRRLEEESPATYASDLMVSLNNLALRLSGVGCRREALEASQEAVGLCRGLAKELPDVYSHLLASLTDNLAVRLSEMGRLREALDVAREAVGAYRSLAKTSKFSTATYFPDLALSLNNLAYFLSVLGNHGEAVEIGREAECMYRDLVKESSRKYVPKLAGVLANLATSLSMVRRLDEAIDAAREGTQLRRDLAKEFPVVYIPELATSLAGLAPLLWGVGHQNEALEVAQEAVGLRRELAQAAPEAYGPDLATSLAGLAPLLWEVGHQNEALEVAQEAVGLRRELAQAAPEAYGADLVTSLSNLVDILAELQHRDEALGAAQEALELYWDLMEISPGVYSSDLAGALNNLSKFLSGVGRRGEALKVAREAVRLYRELVEVSPGVYSSDLAGALNNLSKFLSGVGRRGEALKVAREAVRLCRELVEVSPGIYSSDLAGALNNLSSRLSEMESRDNAMGATWEIGGMWRGLAWASPKAYAHGPARLSNTLVVLPSEVGCSGEAVEAAQEAVGLYRELAKVSQEAHAPDLAMSLSNLSSRLSEVGSWDNAVEAAREAVGLYRELAEVSPEVYIHDLARLSNTLVILLSEVGCSGEALEAAREAVGLYRELVKVSPSEDTPNLAISLNNLAKMLSDMGCLSEALEAAREAVGLYRELVKVSPSDYTPNLVTSLNNLAILLSKTEVSDVILSVFTEDFDHFSPALRSRLLLARAMWRDADQVEDLKEAAREADQPDDPKFLGPTRRMVAQALADAGCNDAGLPAWATATGDESVSTRITDWQRCRDLKEQAAHLKSNWASPSKSDRDALAVEADLYVDIPAIGRLLSLVDAGMVEGVDSVVAWLNSVDRAQSLAVDWYSAHTSGRGAFFLHTQLREHAEDSVSGADQPGDIDEDSRTLSDSEIRAVVLEILEANLPEEGFTELRRTLELAEVSNADIAYAVLASPEDAEDALKELLEAGHWRAMRMVSGLRSGLEEKSIHGCVAASLHAAVSERPDQAHDLLRSAYEKADPGDRTLIEVLMLKASRADDCPQEIADLCAWFLKERSLRGEAGNSSPTSPS